MIVLDEQLRDAQIRREFARWYKGTITTINDLRPRTRILDDVVPTLLRTVNAPTFVTINYADYWRKIAANRNYCVVCLRLEQDEALRAPQLTREVLSLPQYRTKRARMGAVISVRGHTVADYRA